jgi:nitroreductase
MLQGDELRQFDEMLSTARSVRRRLDFARPVERTVLLECIDVAVQAPTGAGGENWRFVIVDEPSKKAAISAIYGDVLVAFARERRVPLKPAHRALMDRMHEFPALVFACMATEPAPTRAGHAAFYGSILPAAWSLMLALRARGIGATWTTLLAARHEEVAELLGLPDGASQIVMMPIGYTKDAVLKKADRAPAHAVTYWNSWEGEG